MSLLGFSLVDFSIVISIKKMMYKKDDVILSALKHVYLLI